MSRQNDNGESAGQLNQEIIVNYYYQYYYSYYYYYYYYLFLLNVWSFSNVQTIFITCFLIKTIIKASEMP